MGNCLKKESTADQWGGEEWDEFLNSKPSNKSSTPAPISETESRRRSDNKCKKVRFDAHVEGFGEGCDEEVEQEKESSKQVRIKISKKQLDKLLGKVELLGSLKVDEMMSLLINGLEEADDDNGQKGWRPVLKTIPELCDVNQDQ